MAWFVKVVLIQHTAWHKVGLQVMTQFYLTPWMSQDKSGYRYHGRSQKVSLKHLPVNKLIFTTLQLSHDIKCELIYLQFHICIDYTNIWNLWYPDNVIQIGWILKSPHNTIWKGFFKETGGQRFKTITIQYDRLNRNRKASSNSQMCS